MQVRLHAFPAVYLNANCTKHHCLVSVRIEPSQPYQTEASIGAQVIAVGCHTGGPVDSADCTDDWVLSVSAPGDINIVS